MFGGLDMKGSDKSGDKGGASSGFSFMNSAASTPSPAPAPTLTAPTSSFGFMNNSAKPAESNSMAMAPAPATATSGFDFMSTTSATPAPSAPTKEISSSSATPSSGFSFMAATPSSSSSIPAPAPSSNGGLSFLSSAPPAKMTSSLPNAAAAVSAPAAGAGISFGSASKSNKKPIKRRARAPKVGSAAVSIPAPPTSSYTTSSSSSINNNDDSSETSLSTKQAAEKAAARAEQFMEHKKLQEQSRLGQIMPHETISAVGLKEPTLKLDGTKSMDDEDFQQAIRAAEEAQARLAKEASQSNSHHSHQSANGGGGKSAFSWFSGLKKSSAQQSAPPATESASTSTHSMNMGASALAAAVTAGGQPSATISSIPVSSATSEENISSNQNDYVNRNKIIATDSHSDDGATVWDKPVEQERSTTTPSRILSAPSRPGWKSVDNSSASNNMSRPAATTSPTPPSRFTTTPPRSRHHHHRHQVTPVVSAPTPEPRIPTPPPPTPRQKLHAILDKVAQQAKRSMEALSDLRQQHNMLVDERFVALAKERLAIQQIAQTESLQMEAAEQEDYDLADRLQVVLDGHEREKAECSAVLSSIGKALQELQQQTPSVVENVAKCFGTAQEELEQFADRQEEEESRSDGEAMKRFSTTSKQLSSENERLKQELKHLEREEDLIQEERKELDEAIGDQTMAMEESREEARSQLEAAEREIDELRSKLRAKETEATQLRMLMETQDSDIAKVLAKFNRQIARVQKKETAVKENRQEWQNEKAAYEKLKEAHDAEVKAHADILMQKSELKETIISEIKLADSFRSIIASEVSLDVSHGASGSENKDENDLAQLQADVVECEAAVAEAKSVLKTAEISLVDLDAERKRIETKLPKLEKEKKEAAAKRDFKTAGKASKEIKEATARLKALQDSLLDEAKEKRETAQKDLAKAQESLKVKKSLATEKEKESGKVAMDKIADKIVKLIATKKRMCQGDAPKLDNHIKAIGAFVLNGQIEALKLQGQSLGDKFGGWEEVAAIFKAEEEEEKEKVNEDQKDGDEGETKETDEQKEQKQDESEEPQAEAAERPEDEVVEENVVKGKDLMRRLTEVETKLEAAVAEEDYDQAATLDEELETIKSDLTNLNLTDAETQRIISTGEESTSDEEEETKTNTNDTDENEEVVEEGTQEGAATDENDKAEESAEATPIDAEGKKEDSQSPEEEADTGNENEAKDEKATDEGESNQAPQESAAVSKDDDQ